LKELVLDAADGVLGVAADFWLGLVIRIGAYVRNIYINPNYRVLPD